MDSFPKTRDQDVSTILRALSFLSFVPLLPAELIPSLCLQNNTWDKNLWMDLAMPSALAKESEQLFGFWVNAPKSENNSTYAKAAPCPQ